MHITISGRLGSGKSTVSKILKEKYGFEIYSTGAIQREMAKKMNLTTLEMNELCNKDSSFDHMIDDAVTKLSIERKDDKLLFDSRMAWHFAQFSFRVFMTIDPQIAGNRCVLDRHGADESYETAEEARDMLMERARVENVRFKEIYGVDNLDYRNYDLIIDSSYVDQYTVADIIVHQFEDFCQDPEHFRQVIYFSPKIIYPYPKSILAGDTIDVFPYKGFHYVRSGLKRVRDALFADEKLVSCRLAEVPENFEKDLDETTEASLRLFEKACHFKYETIPPEIGGKL